MSNRSKTHRNHQNHSFKVIKDSSKIRKIAALMNNQTFGPSVPCGVEGKCVTFLVAVDEKIETCRTNNSGTI